MADRKVRWCLVAKSTNKVLAYEKSLYEALEAVRNIPGVEVQLEVEIRERRNPTHAEMAQELGLPEWADAVSGGGN